MEGLPLGVEGLPLGWRVYHWGGGFTIGGGELTIGVQGLPLGVEGLPLGSRFDIGGQCRVAMGDGGWGEGRGYTDVICQILER